jgi:hypothetical protein
MKDAEEMVEQERKIFTFGNAGTLTHLLQLMTAKSDFAVAMISSNFQHDVMPCDYWDAIVYAEELNCVKKDAKSEA